MRSRSAKRCSTKLRHVPVGGARAASQAAEAAEATWTNGGRVAIRDSKTPEAGVLLFTRAQVDSWMKRLKNGVSDQFG
ncbi:DUF397 domain-containing protein [Saccharopolyspora sp. NPDC050389]|uniref:DUF397 domain-containing protein n=1 Tax=Saccharopolyspora sp. NPDC050389 TaxID=3155516 RepID=UPI0033F68103